jgi:DNA gyrase/topoisomerase IV subunit B
MSKYIKLDQREHVLKRPNMYIGSVEEDIYNTYVFNEEENTIVKKDIKFIPGLYKIFDEILVNAIDHITRLKEQNSEHPVKNIKIDIDKENNIITVLNDGQGIDIEKHDEYDMYIPELIFGHLLTSSNYDDNQERTIGGLNGIGAKAVSIFSSYFKLTTVDYKKQLKYTQLFENNLSKINKPSITKYTRKPFTSIEFKPDYEKFNTEGLTDDMYNIIIKRIYDACAITDNDINIYLNSKKLEYKNFEKYTTIYIGNEKKVYEKINDRWEIIVSINNNNTGFQQISFVNGIWTIKGGKHVDCILNQITKKLGEIIVKKNKNITVSPKMIKDSLILFVKCIIPNPTFDSQSKEVLTTALSKIKVEVDDKTIDKIYKLGIIDRIVQFSNIQNTKLSQKTDGKKKSIIKGIPQLEDAHLAGTSKSKDCILILTEGLSASSMAISGISVVGKDKYGVFPLKGKILNVKDVSEKKIIDNDEISNLKKIIGLQSGKDYSKNKDELRYNQVMIMTDQDSVVGDTPILFKKDNEINIDAIENLSTEWIQRFNGKEYGYVDFQVWSEEGWTDVIHIMRHKTKKRIFRIATPTGIVDVTEDHSLLDENINIISPLNIKIGTNLLHNYPNNIKFTNEVNDIYQLYDTNYDINEKVMIQKLYFMCRCLNYNVILELKDDNVNFKITKEQIENENKVISIIDLGITEQYVYDFETKNHHFQAGIGQIIVKNTDGSHIKGLLFNLFHTLWPSLITNDGFTSSLLTPIVKAKKGSECIQFYSLTDYENWKTDITNIKSWNIKYYKGLGTSDSKEAKEYFKEMKKIEYKWDDESNECIDLAFNKKRADDRKAWLSEYNRNNILDYTNMNVTYPEFIHKDLIHFSNYDIERSIPSMIDGLKTSQRKILYSCFKRNLIDKEIRVSQLAAYISENTCYHHGEASLQSTIVGMAQDFVCSNNINLLMPIGQFGSRIHGGKDAGQSRYIHTMLSKECCNIFKKEDRNILNYLDDDGTSIEPQFYVPTIPMILVNGALGIATGFSTNIPCFNPNDITEVLKLLIKNENVDNYELKPWYKGFNGEIFKKEDKYFSKGIYKKNKNKIIVTELPIGVWIYDYKCHLEDILDVSNSKYLSDFKSYENNSSDTVVNIELVFNNENVINDYLNTIENNGFNKFENNFKMITSKQLSMTNMYAFNENGQIQKFSNPVDIIKRFYEVRLEYYSKRKEYICNNITNELNIMNNKIRFITEVIEEKLIIHKIKKIELDEYLDNNSYDKINDNYDYIIKIPIYNFTIDKVDNLKKEKESLNEKFNHIKNKSIEDMWDDELLKFDIQDTANVNINVKKKAVKKI